MEPNNINLHDLRKIPANEFTQHFRDWMEQDDIARSLQAKLRKDLITNFNKTSLGKKIISEEAISRRLTLSPLILALNTLVAEFLYAQNCHFTLSVFCTEVPHRNTLPDFDGTHSFRFSEREIFEIFDALCTDWARQTKDVMCREYLKRNNYSLLFVILKSLLKSKGNTFNENPPPDVQQEIPQKIEIPQKLECPKNNFRYFNKYLIILSKKVKEMSANLELMQKQKSAPQSQRKSLQARKFENLNRSLEKISDNLRQMSVSRRKNKRLTSVVSAVDTMAKQFERCALNFEQISRGAKGTGNATSGEKSYSDWIKEMRTTDNGKKFLQKIESSLKKALHRENENFNRELDQRLQLQKGILKNKYKEKLLEEIAKYTTRGNEETIQKSNENFEQKLKEFEVKHQVLHQRIHKAEERIMEAPPPKADFPTKHPVIHIGTKGTQTATDSKSKATSQIIPVDTHDQLQKMVKTISEQERQIDHIVFDAKLRIQELEHESNQLDRSFRDYLERQRSEKQKMRKNATSIWQSYALGKSMLDKKCSAFRLPPKTVEEEKHSAIVISDIQPIPTINIDTIASANPPAFENPYRCAQRKVLARSKTLPPPPPLTPAESRVEKCSRYQHQQQHQQQCVFRLIEHSDDDDESKLLSPSPSSLTPQPFRTAIKVTSVAQLSPELNIKDITLEGIEMSPATAVSSSLRSADSNGSSSSPRGVFKLRRQLFTATDNGGSVGNGGGVDSVRGIGSPSSGNGQQMNSNDNKEAEEPLKQINKETSDDGKISIDGDRKDVASVNAGTSTVDGVRTLQVLAGGSSGNKMEAPLTGVEDDVSLQSFRLDISTGEAREATDNEF